MGARMEAKMLLLRTVKDFSNQMEKNSPAIIEPGVIYAFLCINIYKKKVS